jgi:hypothetical protein
MTKRSCPAVGDMRKTVLPASAERLHECQRLPTARRVDCCHDLAAQRPHLRREHAPFAAAHDVEGDPHCERERLGMGASLLFGHGLRPAISSPHARWPAARHCPNTAPPRRRRQNTPGPVGGREQGRRKAINSTLSSRKGRCRPGRSTRGSFSRGRSSSCSQESSRGSRSARSPRSPPPLRARSPTALISSCSHLSCEGRSCTTFACSRAFPGRLPVRRVRHSVDSVSGAVRVARPGEPRRSSDTCSGVRTRPLRQSRAPGDERRTGCKCRSPVSASSVLSPSFTRWSADGGVPGISPTVEQGFLYGCSRF